MKILVAGATGAIGRRLLPLLVERGHEVAATTRSSEKARRLFELGAMPITADGLRRDDVVEAVRRAEPEVIVHQMTSLGAARSLMRFDHVFARTNRLRTQGTDHLLEAARMVGARRFVAQSFGNWNYERSGAAVKTEDAPFDPDPPRSMRRTLAAIASLEVAVLGAGGIEGIALRYGNFYGPGTGIAEDGEIVDAVRKRRLPVIGNGAGVWSFIHVDDAATATLAAIERATPGVYNVCDDEPAEASVWLPVLAAILGAEPPRHLPEWTARLLAGEAAVSMFTRARGASNARAKAQLRWRLGYPTWRDGFRDGLGLATSSRLEQLREAA
jgi:nucleoside-diphosphate-sugar epimerase